MTQDTERIRVGEEADGGEPVELPVIDVLAGRGFITGKSGSGKSNTASVVAEQLLEAGYGLLIVDVDGEYYGLKEEYELLHAGADEECDIRVSPEHAEKLASLALEENVPIILDVSSYLDPDDADEMLLAVARQLFAKAKKQKKPFLVLVEECHEYIPEGGGMTETGKMLIKIGKRGRKHGLGIVGMSQRPADVKKDFITQCDWMVWHRLTWDNDTRVVGRILGNEYADRVEELNDGEAFLDTDWTDTLRRVQFDRKRTFDAGATPGLEEFERPDLQSVSAELVADLQEVSAERERHESELQTLEAELAEKEQRIEELEAELAEARDMSEMADRFAQALVDNGDASPDEPSPPESEVAEAEAFVADGSSIATAGGYPGSDPVPTESMEDTEDANAAPESDADGGETELLPEEQRDLHAYAVSDGGTPEEDGGGDGDEDTESESAPESDENAESSGLQPVRTISNKTETEAEATDPDDDEGSVTQTDEEETAENAEPTGEQDTGDSNTEPAEPETWDEGPEVAAESEATPAFEPDDEPIEATGDWPTPDGERTAHATEAADPDTPTDPERTAELERQLSEEFGVTMESSSNLTGGSLGSSTNDSRTNTETEDDPEGPDETATDAETAETTAAHGADGSSAVDESDQVRGGERKESSEREERGESEETDGCEKRDEARSHVDPTADRGERLTELVEDTELRNEEGVVQVFVHGIEALDDVTLGMLKHYRNAGKVTPVDAHIAAGGSGERQYAYARNRTLRTAGVVEHAGGGRYRYRLPDLVAEVFDGNAEEATLSETVSTIEEAVGLTE